MPGGQHENQPRQKQCQPRVSEVKRLVRDLIDLPRHRQRLRLGAHDDKHSRHLVAPKVARQKCGSRSTPRVGAA